MQNLITINQLNIEKICRTCLFHCNESNSLFDIFDSSELCLADKLRAFTQVQIIQNDGFPSQMCSECTNQTINAYNFKMKAEQSEQILLNYINEQSAKNVESNKLIHQKDYLMTIKVETETVSEHDEIKNINDQTIEVDGLDETQCKNETQFDEHISGDILPNESETEVITKGGSFDGIKNFCCELCNEIFVEKELFDNHYLRMHQEQNHKSCEICSENFQDDYQLKLHMEQHSETKVFNCSECCEKFETNFELKVHRSTVHTNKKRRKASVKLDKQSSDISLQCEYHEIDNNLCMPNGQKTIQCKICDMKFKKIVDLRIHLETHKSFENFTFDSNNFFKNQFFKEETDFNAVIAEIINALENGKLSKFYSIVNELSVELRLSDSETEDSDNDNDNVNYTNTNAKRLYACEICNKNFDRKYKAFYHQKSFHKQNEMNHQCCYCKQKFISIDLLNAHLKSQCENDEKQLTCSECNMKFMWHENLIQHSNLQHSLSPKRTKKTYQIKEKTFICKICDKSFYRQEHLDRHSSIHQPDEKKFECPTCHKKFNRKDNMKSHTKIHREDRDKDDVDKHLCIYCGRSFSNSSNLIVHMRRHTGEKPYKCDLCDKGFPRSSDLLCHRRTHTGEKPCLCTICGKGFSRSNKLARHMRIHTGVRPYKCTYCDRAFTQSNDLTLHIRRHTGDKPFVCGICGERFIQGTALHTHRRLKGHYEETAKDAPYASISVNNPNRLNFSNRVNRIGITKKSSTQDPVEIKPVGRGNTRISVTEKNKCNLSDDIVKQSLITPTNSDAVSNGLCSSVITEIDTNNISNINQTGKNITNYIQSSIPITSSSAFLTAANVPYVQMEEGDFFTITNIGYQSYN